MRKEPILVGEVIKAVMIAAMFWTPLGEAIAAVGGEAALTSAAATVWGLVTFFVQRGRVSPV